MELGWEGQLLKLVSLEGRKKKGGGWEAWSHVFSYHEDKLEDNTVMSKPEPAYIFSLTFWSLSTPPPQCRLRLIKILSNLSGTRWLMELVTKHIVAFSQSLSHDWVMLRILCYITCFKLWADIASFLLIRMLIKLLFYLAIYLMDLINIICTFGFAFSFPVSSGQLDETGGC